MYDKLHETEGIPCKGHRYLNNFYTIFFKTYSEKLWGISCSDLDSDFASQRIKKLSLSEALKNAVAFKKSNKHATLLEQFAYPINGTGSVYTKMMDKLKSRGGNVYLNTPVNKVITKNNKAVAVTLESGRQEAYDHIISTMPMTHLVERLEGLPVNLAESVRSLRFRNTILVYLLVDRSDLFPDQWLYIHDPEVKTGRISNFRNWVPELYGTHSQSILCMEYWCDFSDTLWTEDDKFMEELAKREIDHIGIAAKKDVLDASVLRIPRCYPVYFSGYQEKLKPVQEFLDTIGQLHVIGRYGAYKYNNQDHSILMGMLAAENILSDAGHNLWSINTDYEVYQESATITKTGLTISEDN